VQLPTGRVVALDATEPARAARRERSLFADALALFETGGVRIRADGAPVEVRSLDLRDFHTLRAILTRLGWLEEATVEVPCRNCERVIEHAPCAALELGPFVDRELTNPVLDATLDLTSSHPIPAVRFAGGTARDVTLQALRVEQAMPLFAALGGGRLRVTRQVAQAMGVVRLGDLRSLEKIARALQRAPEAAWSAITNLYLDAHYPPRLFSVAMCPDCGARNDVDAPYDREFDYGDGDETDHASAREKPQPNRHPGPTASRTASRTKQDVFPTFDAFAERTRALAEEIMDAREIGGIEVVAEGGVPACDDGGEPLLGSYVPPDDGDGAHPSRAAAVTVYYRTFRAMWTEDGPYDWDGELRETVDHELTHHLGYLAGDDPMDDEERREIAKDTEEIVGKRALARGAVFGLYRDLGDFTRRTWPIWVLAFIVTLIAALGAR
jgi:hypothetical protein